MFADFRSAFRQISRNRGLAILTVSILALGIGANTAIYSVIYAALIKPLPYPEPGRLVGVFEQVPDGGRNAVSGGAFKDWKEHSSSFAQLAISELVWQNLTGSGTPILMAGLRVSSEFLPVLGVDPVFGRGIATEEGALGGDSRVVVLTDELWRSHFGGSEAVLGKALLLDQTPHTVVGVLPPRALLNDEVMFLTPLVIDSGSEGWSRAGHWKKVWGRLADGVTPAQAQTELRGIKEQLTAEYPQFKEDWSVAVAPLQEVVAGDTRSTLILLLSTVALVLLIACANVSNLLLARGSARFREMAIRSSLGAHSWRLVRQMLIESLVLALLGCWMGLLLAEFGIDLLIHLFADQLPRALHPELDGNVLAFSIVVACGCGLLFGILPALRAGQAGFGRDLKEVGRGSTSGSQKRSQSFLVMAEFSFTVLLLVAAGLLLRSFLVLLQVDPGFEPKGTLAFDLSFPEAKYPEAADRVHYIAELREGLSGLPGVESVAATSALPLSLKGQTELANRVDRPERFDYLVQCNYISGDYIKTLGLRLLKGRFLTEEDHSSGATRTLVISSDIAATQFSGEEPIGQFLRILGDPWEIVGVVAPVRHFMLDMDPVPGVYMSQSHSPWSTSLILRTAVPPGTLTEAVRVTVQAADPDQPIANVRSLEQAVQQSLAPRRLTLTLLGWFAVVAIFLAAIGIYGVVSYSIDQRTREISIRSALGAGRRDVVRLIVSGGMKPSLIGIAIGVGLALAMSRGLQSLLFGIRPYDPAVFGGSVVLLATAAALSILLPARRAAKIDPTVALRVD